MNDSIGNVDLWWRSRWFYRKKEEVGPKWYCPREISEAKNTPSLRLHEWTQVHTLLIRGGDEKAPWTEGWRMLAHDFLAHSRLMLSLPNLVGPACTEADDIICVVQLDSYFSRLTYAVLLCLHAIFLFMDHYWLTWFEWEVDPIGSRSSRCFS